MLNKNIVYYWNSLLKLCLTIIAPKSLPGDQVYGEGDGKGKASYTDRH